MCVTLATVQSDVLITVFETYCVYYIYAVCVCVCVNLCAVNVSVGRGGWESKRECKGADE